MPDARASGNDPGGAGSPRVPSLLADEAADWSQRVPTAVVKTIVTASVLVAIGLSIASEANHVTTAAMVESPWHLLIGVIQDTLIAVLAIVFIAPTLGLIVAALCALVIASIPAASSGIPGVWVAVRSLLAVLAVADVLARRRRREMVALLTDGGPAFQVRATWSPRDNGAVLFPYDDVTHALVIARHLTVGFELPDGREVDEPWSDTSPASRWDNTPVAVVGLTHDGAPAALRDSSGHWYVTRSGLRGPRWRSPGRGRPRAADGDRSGWTAFRQRRDAESIRFARRTGRWLPWAVLPFVTWPRITSIVSDDTSLVLRLDADNGSDCDAILLAVGPGAPPLLRGGEGPRAAAARLERARAERIGAIPPRLRWRPALPALVGLCWPAAALLAAVGAFLGGWDHSRGEPSVR